MRSFFLLSIIAVLCISCGQNTEKQGCVPVKTSDNKCYAHFSLDDVTTITKSLSSYTGETIFKNPILATLKEWHTEYGIVASLYVQGDFCINSRYAQELIDNCDWLKWGYHGNTDNARKKDVLEFYKQVMDAIGTDAIIDDVPRLHYFAGDRHTCSTLQQMGCSGFLGCDDWSWNSAKRVNYYLDNKNSSILDEEGALLDTISGLYFVKTDFRLEQISQRWGDVQHALQYYSDNSKQARELIIFSHEWCFSEYKQQADSIFNWAKNNGYTFDFPTNNLK